MLLVGKREPKCTVLSMAEKMKSTLINPHILAIVKSIDSKFGILKVLILTSNATEHFFILH